MNNSSDDLVGALAILMIFGMPMAFLIVNRYYAHQERIEMIRRGVTPPDDSRWAARAARYAARSGAPYYYEDQPNRNLRRGMTVAMVGLALLIGLSFVHPGQVGPWLLGGLIPLFVGIAQIINAVIAGAHLGPFGGMFPPGQPPAAGPFDQGKAQGTTPDFSAPPYGWRPGPTTELEKPAGPPDVR